METFFSSASWPRLYVTDPLSLGAMITLRGNQAHYLAHVMRVKTGDAILLFDDVTGEWLAQVQDVGKREVALTVTQQIDPRESVPDFWLLAAPVKKARLDMVAEKACELGVARYQPVLTRRTIVDRVNLDRLRATMVEAAEQCGRTALPTLGDPIKLTSLLKDWSPDRHLFFADETGGVPLSQAVLAHPGPAAMLVGPEGGFDAEERSLILNCPQAVGISLGPRILRAETAAIAATSLWMSINGDWNSLT
jgi:16S rRNA (uracil1498-N3)-methyltransferase